MFVPNIPTSSSSSTPLPLHVSSGPLTPAAAAEEGAIAFGLHQMPFPPNAGPNEFCNLLLDKYLHKARVAGSNQYETSFIDRILLIIQPVLQRILQEEPGNEKLEKLIDTIGEMLDWEQFITDLYLQPQSDIPSALSEKLIDKMNKSSKVVIPFNWTASGSAHQLIFTFIKRNGYVTWEIYNTGMGTDYHSQISPNAKFPRSKICPRYVIDEIPLSIFESREFLNLLFKKTVPLQNNEHITPEKRASEIYNEMAFLSEGIVVPVKAYQNKYGEDYEFVDPQQSCTCAAQVIYAFMLMTLGDRRLYSRIKHRISLHLFNNVSQLNISLSHLLNARHLK